MPRMAQHDTADGEAATGARRVVARRATGHPEILPDRLAFRDRAQEHEEPVTEKESKEPAAHPVHHADLRVEPPEGK
jgi:hypothetical protein